MTKYKPFGTQHYLLKKETQEVATETGIILNGEKEVIYTVLEGPTKELKGKRVYLAIDPIKLDSEHYITDEISIVAYAS